jgi:adenylate cyclase
MADEGFKRKLTAVLSADAVGYSRLMAEDEADTVKTLATYREIMSSLIKQHRGRVVDSPGDNVLAEFSSVVDAVQCAVAVQNEFQTRNAELNENRRMEFRIGINLGDVIDEEDRIYGDGVNIAARLEALADPGGICVSKTAFDQIETKLPLGYEYLGEQSVKNILKPVGAYRVLMKPEAVGKVIGEKRFLGRFSRKTAMTAIIVLLVVAGGLVGWNIYLQQLKKVEPASVEKMAFPLPDKPSIAVLPFANIGGDPEQEYFSDGLTEEIITALSKFSEVFVIASNSVFTYKGKPVKVQQVSEELGVRYVLEGSVRKASDRVRITAQLIDATTGHHVWSERYDRDLEDIFAIQDNITLEIMNAMQVSLLGHEQARHWKKHGTKNLEAYLKLLGWYSKTGTKEGVAQFRQACEEAIVLDPEYALAYAYVGWTHFIDARYGWSDSPAESIKAGFEYGQKAVALDDALDWGHITMASIYLAKRQLEKAVAEGEKAVALNPNGADAYCLLAGAVGCSGRWEESITFGKKSIRLNPFPPVANYWVLGRAYFMTGQYDKSIATFKKALKTSPDYFIAHVFLAACYSSIDRQADAAAAAKEVLRINPKFSIESYAKRLPFKNKADIEIKVAALRKAGLPE